MDAKQHRLGDDSGMSLLAHAQPVPSRGVVLFEGSVPPGPEAFGGLRDRGVSISATKDGLALAHAQWGTARLVGAHAEVSALTDALVHPEGLLTVKEREAMARARSGLLLEVDANDESPLVARKRFLRFARAVMGPASLGTLDLLSRRGWSRAAIDDEIALDVWLDVTALFAIHLVSDDGVVPTWLHTHGLGDVGGFDFDVLSPDPAMGDMRMDVVRALAFAILERRAVMGGEPFTLASPDGDVAFVDAAEFMQTAAAEHVALRSGASANDDDHSQARAIVCEPSTHPLVVYLKRPMPSLYTSSEEQPGALLKLSTDATEWSAKRARGSFAHLRLLFEATRRTGACPFVNLGFDDDEGAREHLWFRVNALTMDTIDATLLNAPFAISGMHEGDRAVHSVEQLSDWVAPTSRGAARPWYLAPMRRLRGE